ncbi:uncharacterized protein LOC135097463 isoform X1 [Scylla paramamosain]|uniref:uncharacterized protein LOC135097463 isoform X1 n=1 Tax=Scylla paramamosain TaxID=85552 RepID=UPI003083E17E
MAQDREDMVPLDPELLAELEEEAASRYTEEDNQFTEHCKKSLPKLPILPADRFDLNRQCRGNFRHQDYRKEAARIKGSTEVMGIIGIVGITGITGGNILTTGKGGLSVTTEIMMTAEGIARRGSTGLRRRVMSMEEGITSPANTTMGGGGCHPVEFCESSGWYIYLSSGTSHKLPRH